ncbi:hypothetical protein [Photobacterium lutimaris]|uniref:hypothetical protein n=1 Tax=Photobacterium lutimaris TaxID=388278 RepID=UPI001060889F|nr:hypothetical protein [Photobacterium lutimaris]
MTEAAEWLSKGKPDRSPYVKDSKILPFLRDKILKEQSYELERLNAVIKDPEVPFNSLEVRTNELLAIPYFQSLIDKYDILGHVKFVETSIKQSGGG